MRKFLMLIMMCAFVLFFSGLTIAADETKPAAPAGTADGAPTTPAAPPPVAAPPVAPPPAATPPAATPPAVAPPAAASVNLSGKWSSKITDHVNIEQTGDKIVGTYEYKDDDGVTLDGRIDGSIQGKTVKGKWYERPKVGSGKETRGDLEWKIADDGKMLSGWFRSEGEKEKEDWNLER